MTNYLLVGLGGFLGSILRFSLGLTLKSSFFQQIPLPIIVVNILGALILGVLISFGQNKLGSHVYHLLVPGLLGGFTTFSTFSGETFLLIKQELYLSASLYILMTLVGGLIAVALGYYLGNYFSRPTVL